MPNMYLPGLLLFLSPLHAAAPVQQAPAIQVLKIAAGPSGTETNGVFRLSEERTVFSRTTDREIVVYFQWEHVPGPHKLVAQWRSNDGGASSSSVVDYNATDKRFGAIWRIPITADMPLGTWSLDATMDGRPAGRFTFEISDAAVAAAATRRPLTQAELYERLNRLFVVLRRTAADGRELEPAAGFAAAPASGRIYTVVPALDAADTLRAITADGATVPITHLVMLNRRAQWAIIQGPSGSGSSLPARGGSLAIGTPCFSIEGTTAGIRVLIGGTISGQVAVDGVQVPIATFPRAVGMPGAPIVDEYGELLGIVGAGLPGDSRPVDDILDARGTLNGAPVIPIASITPPPIVVPSELAVRRAAGDLMPSVADKTFVSSGIFARGPLKKGDTSPPPAKEFSTSDAAIALVLTWAPMERLRGNALVRVLNADNQLVVQSQPRKVNFNKGDYARSSWDLPALKTPGIYRVDVVVEARTYWRGFFRVHP